MAIPIELAHDLEGRYGISKIISVAPVAAGFLSENHILETTKQKYFLKQYRYVNAQEVAAVHEAKNFFARAGVPVILPVASKTGETFFAFAQRYYSLFPFVRSRTLQRGTLPLPALASSARMLAKIHIAGNGAAMTHVRKAQPKPSYEKFLHVERQVLREIPRDKRTAFDELAEACVRLKMQLAKQNEAAFSAIALTCDHLIHGDYQDANLFFDQRDDVSHVFDWEKAELAPRGLELARAIEFMCLSNADNYKAVFSEASVAKARHFLWAYAEHYAISRSEFFAAVRTRYLHKILSLWVESAHYLNHNIRTDVFLESEYGAVVYFSQHLDTYVERVSGGILA